MHRTAIHLVPAQSGTQIALHCNLVASESCDQRCSSEKAAIDYNIMLMFGYLKLLFVLDENSKFTVHHKRVWKIMNFCPVTVLRSIRV